MLAKTLAVSKAQTPGVATALDAIAPATGILNLQPTASVGHQLPQGAPSTDFLIVQQDMTAMEGPSQTLGPQQPIAVGVTPEVAQGPTAQEEQGVVSPSPSLSSSENDGSKEQVK